MMKKCLSLLLVLAMLLSVCPMGVFAEGDNELPIVPPGDTEGAADALNLNAADDGSRASADGDGLVLVAIYDRDGKRMLASEVGEGNASVELGEDVIPDEGKGYARAFLLEAETLIPLAMAEREVTFPAADDDQPEETMGLDAAEPTEETTEPTEETTEPTEEATEAPEETEAAEEPTEEATEAPEEELTTGEAAQEGYYVAPEGAQMEEVPVLEEMAAFSGKTVNKGEQTRTTTFSGLMPGELYFFAVSKTTGSPDDIADVVAPENLVYADAKEALSDGTLTFENYQLTTGEAVIVQLYGYSNVRSIRFKDLLESDDDEPVVDEDGNTVRNLTLQVGESYDLGVLVEPEEWGDSVIWSTTNSKVASLEEDVKGIENTVTAGTPGIAYVKATATHGAYTISATCRVRVVNLETEHITDVELRDTSVTTELYRTEGTLISVFPEFSQRKASTQSAFNAGEGNADGHLIKLARFGTDLKQGDKNYDKEVAAADKMNELFDLEVVDDWTLRLVPTQYAVENPGEVVSKYSSKIALYPQEGEGENDEGEMVPYCSRIVTSKVLTVNVKKSTPKLTADSIQINSFYDEKSYKINVKGATVVGIGEADGKTLPDWLDLSENELTPAVVDKNAHSGTVYLSVETKEWAIPAEVKVSVSMRYTAPALRLSAKTVTLASFGSKGTTIQLLSQDRSKKLEDMYILGVTASGQLDSGDKYDPETGKWELVLTPTGEELTNGTVNFEVSFEDASNTLVLPLQIKTVTPKLHLEKTSVTMNTKVGDTAKIKLYMTPSDAELPDDLEAYVTDTRNRKQEDLDSFIQLNEPEITYDDENGCAYLTVTTDAAAYESGYRVHITTDEEHILKNDLAVLSVKPLARSTNPSVTLRASGTLDLSYPYKGLTLTRTYRNMVAPEEEGFILKINGKEVSDFGDYFHAGDPDSDEKEDAKYYYVNGDADLKKGDKLEILAVGIVDGDTVCTSGKVTLTVKRTPVNIRFASSSVTLNKAMEEEAEIAFTYSPSGKDVKKEEEPIIKVTNNRGIPAEDVLAVTMEDGKLVIVPDYGTVAYGDIYKITMRNSESDNAAALTVKIATEKNSNVAYTTTVSGTLDPTRDASRVTVKYTVRNFADTEPVVKITDTFTREDVTGLFDIVQNEKNLSQFFVTKKPASVLDPSHKYTVVADYADRDELDDGSLITAKAAVLKVAAGKSTVKADRTVTIYKKDPNATYKFAVTSSDKKLNNVERLTIKDSKLQGVYEIVNLGDGNFEIYVKANSLEKVKAGSLTLNYFVRGMAVQYDRKGNEVPNGTLNLKLTVK